MGARETPIDIGLDEQLSSVTTRSRIDRRTFLKVAGVAAGGVLARALTQSPSFGLKTSSSINPGLERTPTGDELEVAVVGRGVSGAFSSESLTL
jgi:hypothetical protein